MRRRPEAPPIYDPATETYTDTVLCTGGYAGNLAAAFVAAAITHRPLHGSGAATAPRSTKG
jgi:hypothetical protein